MKTEKMLEFFKNNGLVVKMEVPYIGDVFTVACSHLILKKKGKQKVILHGEGIARKSHEQNYDIKIGRGTAINRSVEALFKKYRRKRRAIHSWCEG